MAHAGSYLWQESISYVTGTHSLKIGYQHTFMTDDRPWYHEHPEPHLPRQQRRAQSAHAVDLAVGEQHARRRGTRCSSRSNGRLNRLTLQGALRFDRARSWFPEQQEGPSRFLPTPIVIPETRGVDSYKDVTPRFGVAYDVFGNGRTAVNMSIGKYLEGAGVSGTYANTNPTLADAADDDQRLAPPA